MKKLLSLFLSLALVCALAVPAAAADSASERLAAVTAQVKQTLGLDTGAYTDFSSYLDDNPLSSTWYLEWSGDGEYVSVNATQEGKVLYFYRSSNATEPSYSSGGIPSFPAGDPESARRAAQAFLDRVLGEGESARLNEDSGDAGLGSTSYYFYGDILVNGLEAGLSFSLSVECAGNAVTSFYRDDLGGQVMGGVPSSQASVPASQAGEALRGTLALRLEYALSEEEENRAVLRYLPEYGDDYYVDAATGELVNLSERFRQAAEGEFGDAGVTGGGAEFDQMSAAEAPAETENSLSAAEQAGVEKLEGVLDRDALDEAARSYAALGLDQYALATVNYLADEEPDENGVTAVTATLRYGRQVGSSSWRRTVELDARTGGLLGVYSSSWLDEEEGPARTVELEAAQGIAEDFLASIAPERAPRMEQYSGFDALEDASTVSHSFTYAQKVNGYFYTGNSYYVDVDATDGSISYLNFLYDESVTFDSPDGVISEDAAVDAWLNTYDVALSYIQVPAAIDFSQPEYAPLQDMGYSYLYQLALGYALDREDYVDGIDAKTGEPVIPDWSYSTEVTYDDMDGHWAKEKVETLAQYGVGYAGGSFLPDKALTQLDLVALVVSADGYLGDLEDGDDVDYLYRRAYSMGLLKSGERDEDAALTRAQTVKLLLDAAGYGPVARLEGIYRTGFSDDGDIPAAYYGYAALAQGLGVVTGSGGALRPNDAATRAEAAVMLYNLMR